MVYEIIRNWVGFHSLPGDSSRDLKNPLVGGHLPYPLSERVT